MGTLDWLDRHPLEISTRAGLLLGAFTNGLSFQPNLIPRDSRAQAVISGISASTSFGWASASHSFMRSVANRLPGGRRGPAGRAVTGLALDGTVAAGALAATAALGPADDDSPARAVARLAGTAVAASAAAGLVADLLELRRGRAYNRLGSLAAAAACWGAGYAISRNGVSGSAWLPRRLAPHALAQAIANTGPTADSARDIAAAGLTVPVTEGGAIEEEPPQVVVPTAAVAGAAVTGVLLGLSWAESRIGGLVAAAAARAIGGEADDHRTLARGIVWAGIGSAGWWAFTRVDAALERAGTGPDQAHAAAPDLPEVTGGPGSLVPWSAQSRESRRWLTMALTPDRIEAVMGEPARQPVRVYASLESASTGPERAALLLAEIDRTQALRRPVFALFSPTGSGYVNYVATETLEYLTRGDCASAAIQYSVLPSALSLRKVGLGAAQTRAVVNGVMERMLAMSPEERPAFYLFGESLGAEVSQAMFAGQGIGAVDGIGLRAAIWIGTPAASQWRRELWGRRPQGRPPGIGPGAAFLPRSVGDWAALAAEERARVRFLFLQNGNDPVPKFDTPLLWRRPDWLGPDGERPPGAPTGTHWLPVTTFFTTFIDLQNALRPIPGTFVESGHDYRRMLPDVVRSVFGLQATDAQMARVQQALRERELRWEVRRRWAAAKAQPEERRGPALQGVADLVARWTGSVRDLDSVRRLVGADRLGATAAAAEEGAAG